MKVGISHTIRDAVFTLSPNKQYLEKSTADCHYNSACCVIGIPNISYDL